MTPAALRALLEGDYDNFATAATPGGIERQEAQGQRDLVNSANLPTEAPWKELAALGVIKGERVDDLFTSATLSEGWKKEATDHSMWSKLVDADGKVIAQIFYKAAFYDRSAHMYLVAKDAE